MPNDPSERSFEVRLDNLEARIKKPATQQAGSPLVRNESPIIRIGAEFFSGVAVCMLFGIAIDQHWQTYPYGLLLTFFLGISVGTFNVFRVLRRREEAALSLPSQE
jgi:F0F1-type ATP synthase assembly protein I